MIHVCQCMCGDVGCPQVIFLTSLLLCSVDSNVTALPYTGWYDRTFILTISFVEEKSTAASSLTLAVG